MIQIYTGDGKGKTTAALGLGLRAIGAGKKVAVVQFLKPKSIKTGEIIAAKKYLKNILWLNFGLTGFIIGKKISRSAREEAVNGLLAVEKIILQNKFDIVILDEIIVAMHFKLLDEKKVIEIIKQVPKDKEVILTGRKASARLIKVADLVSEIVEIKHYFNQGIYARSGVEL